MVAPATVKDVVIWTALGRPTVMVVPDTDDSTSFVVPETVSVPAAVMAVPDPESAAGVMLVTVPDPPPPVV